MIRLLCVGTAKLALFLIPLLSVACGTLEVGIERTATPGDARPTPSMTTTASESAEATTVASATENARTTPLPVSTPTPSPHMDIWNTYSNPVFAISLEYPADWQPVPGYGGPETGETKFAAINGFFHISAMDAATIDDAAASEAGHILQPYGSRPIIENLQIQGQEARLILPSADQPAGMDYQAALIVRYPQPVDIAGTACRYFILWADQPHIRVIAQTLQFITESEQVEPIIPTYTDNPTAISTPAIASTPITSSPPATHTPAPTETPANPQIFSFEVTPTWVDPGDAVTLTWQASGDRATICPSARFVLFTSDDCQQVPLSGVTTFTIPLEATGFHFIDFLLNVETHGSLPPNVVEQVSVALKCHTTWFFSDEPQAGVCPTEPIRSYAAAQRFERGTMIWIEQIGRYVILDEALLHEQDARKQVDYVHDPLEIIRDTSAEIKPPEGFYAPESGFGLVWRGDVSNSPGYREKLGWALAPEFGYEAIFQCDDALPSGGRSWQTCYLKGPDNEVIVFHPLGGWYLLSEKETDMEGFEDD